jgi:phosphoribosylformylglycinamidine cyclo-ligase
MNERYMQRGVSASKEDVHSAISKLDKGLFPRAFCKIVEDTLGNDPNYCNIMHADGAGTKSSLAYLYWKETGDLSVWRGIAQDAIIMNTDDLLCVQQYSGILHHWQKQKSRTRRSHLRDHPRYRRGAANAPRQWRQRGPDRWGNR